MKEATEEIEVCYLNVFTPLPFSWSRPLSEWTEIVMHEGTQITRFTEINPLPESRRLGERNQTAQLKG
jgi:hypothetical protein